MWWKSRKKDNYLVPHRNDLNIMVSVLLEYAEIDFDSGTQLKQALVATFLFGMINAHGMMHGLTPPEIHALGLVVFKDSLHYTDDAAVQSVQECINAADPNYHATMNSILHRGIDDHRQYLDKDLAGLGQNIISILDQFKE